MYEDVRSLLKQAGSDVYENWQIDLDYHFGGYAKYDEQLIDFIRGFEAQHGMPLDQVYTGKLIYALWAKIVAEEFAPGARIMVLHGGGLQGRLPILNA